MSPIEICFASSELGKTTVSRQSGQDILLKKSAKCLQTQNGFSNFEWNNIMQLFNHKLQCIVNLC